MLDDAVALHRAGRLEDAATAYEAVLADHPDHADAWQLLGLVRHRLGDPTSADAAFRRALALDPDHAPALANHGLVLSALGHAPEAAQAFEQAVALRPGFREPLLNLARLHAQRGDLPAARAAAEDAVAHHPDDGEALQLVGLLRARSGDLEGAVEAWGSALARRRDPGLALGLGHALLQLGRPDDAIAPLALALTGGAPAGALFADATLQARHPTGGLGRGIDDALVQALAHPDVDAQRLERAVRARMTGLDDADRRHHPLTVPWLVGCVVQHPDDLAWLARARDRAVDDALEGRPVDLAFACALAHQAWWTEHADPLDDERAARLHRVPDPGLRLALEALHRPLPLAMERPAGEGPLAQLWDATVGAERDELHRLEGIGILATGDDATSRQVAAMYEANPYPRRVGVHRPPPVPLDATLGSVGLTAPARRPLQVLVAGGGTGQHPLQTATRYLGVEVLAVDLSRRSLARAQRVAEAHGLSDVRFAQADLLALGSLDRRFDVIESVGVLHHLADPLAGWRVLRGLLADDGVMRIGLYAERGRADVVAARALVAAWGLGDTPDDLRAARQRFLALPPDHPARPVVHSPDFPSLSGLRDLVFHPCEHRYTLPRLAAELEALGLRFAGFQHTLPEAALRYRERWPDDPRQADLTRWETLEADQPHLFRGMYVFWCAPA